MLHRWQLARRTAPPGKFRERPGPFPGPRLPGLRKHARSSWESAAHNGPGKEGRKAEGGKASKRGTAEERPSKWLFSTVRSSRTRKNENSRTSCASHLSLAPFYVESQAHPEEGGGLTPTRDLRRFLLDRRSFHGGHTDPPSG